MARLLSRRISAFVFCAALTCAAGADEVQFNNGDRITGKIESIVDGKLKVTGTIAGDLTVNMGDVKTFSTEGPIALKLKDQTTVLRKFTTAGDGKIKPVGEGAPTGEGGASQGDARAISVADIVEYNRPARKWNGSLAVGGMATRGNTKTETLNIAADANYRRDKDRTVLLLGYAYGRSNDDTGTTTNTDNAFASGKYDYFITPKIYTYALTRLDHDRIANLFLRVSPSTGLGYQWVERDDFHVSTEAGVGYVWEKFDNDGTNEYVSLRLAYHVDKKINDRLTLFHNLEYVPSVEAVSDFNVNTDAGLRVSLTKSMFTEFKVEMKYDSEPAPEASDTDVRYLLNVGWTF